LHEQVFVPGPELLQLAWASQLPLFVEQESTGSHTMPLPEYPALQVHTTAPPCTAHAAVMAHPPLSVAQAPAPVQVIPLPE
jgi:hypothetical protein